MCVGVLLQGFGYLELPPLDSLSKVCWYLYWSRVMGFELGVLWLVHQNGIHFIYLYFQLHNYTWISAFQWPSSRTGNSPDLYFSLEVQ